MIYVAHIFNQGNFLDPRTLAIPAGENLQAFFSRGISLFYPDHFYMLRNKVLKFAVKIKLFVSRSFLNLLWLSSYLRQHKSMYIFTTQYMVFWEIFVYL